MHIEICQFIDIYKYEIPSVFLMHIFYFTLIEIVLLNFYLMFLAEQTLNKGYELLSLL